MAVDIIAWTENFAHDSGSILMQNGSVFKIGPSVSLMPSIGRSCLDNTIPNLTVAEPPYLDKTRAYAPVKIVAVVTFTTLEKDLKPS